MLHWTKVCVFHQREHSNIITNLRATNEPLFTVSEHIPTILGTGETSPDEGFSAGPRKKVERNTSAPLPGMLQVLFIVHNSQNNWLFSASIISLWSPLFCKYLTILTDLQLLILHVFNLKGPTSTTLAPPSDNSWYHNVAGPDQEVPYTNSQWQCPENREGQTDAGHQETQHSHPFQSVLWPWPSFHNLSRSLHCFIVLQVPRTCLTWQKPQRIHWAQIRTNQQRLAWEANMWPQRSRTGGKVKVLVAIVLMRRNFNILVCYNMTFRAMNFIDLGWQVKVTQNMLDKL